MPARPPFIKDNVDRTEENRLIERLGGGEVGRKKLQERIEQYSYLNNKNWDDPRVGVTYPYVGDKVQEKIQDAYVQGNIAQSAIQGVPEGYGAIKLLLKQMKQSNANVFKVPVALTRHTPKHPAVNWAIESGFRMMDAGASADEHDERLRQIESMTYSPEEHAREMLRPAVWDPNRSPMPERFSTPPQTEKYQNMGPLVKFWVGDKVIPRHPIWSRLVKPVLQAAPSSLFAAHDWIRSTMPVGMGGRYSDESPMDYQMRTGLNMDPMGTYTKFSRPNNWRPLKPRSDKNPGGSEADLQHIIKLYNQDLDRERDDAIIARSFSL